MDETPSRPLEESTTKAVKDKNCPYCQQAFTSSSLGRHLDLYIKEKNPKAPDGVHDVEAIRRIRQNITRRQPKGAVARRATSASVGTPASVSQKSPDSVDAESSVARSPLSQRGASQAKASTANKYPFNKPTWETTGVINGLVVGEGGASRDAPGEGASRGSRPGPSQRSASRQTLKQQLDRRQQVQDAQDKARAAELALRELLSSLRSAKQQIDLDSMPFDFDPFSLDFPALTLQCLEPPPTLFASTQHPTPASWSILPPGPSQLEALHAYFREEFRQWKFACAGATTAVAEELTYPPSSNAVRTDTKAEVLAAEKAAEKMEKHVYDHLGATYSIWNGLPQEQREQLWKLELARGVGRKQKEVDKLKEGQRLLQQENANLKTQIEQLTRLQQPREFKIAPPSTVYFDDKLMRRLLEHGIGKEKQSVGFSLTDRHSDLGTVVSSVIDRWKNVIVSARSASGGLQLQRPLDTTATGEPSPAGSNRDMSSVHPGQGTQRTQQPLSDYHRPPQSQYPSTTGASYPASSASTATSLTPRIPTTPAVPSGAPSLSTHPDENEDEDDDDDVSMSGQDAEPDADPDADGDAEGDTDADADADMDDGPEEYTDAQLQQLQQQQQQRLLHPAVATLPQHPGRLELSRMRHQMGGGRSAADGGMAGHGAPSQGQGHGRGQVPNWA